jgi:hypothetical protein
MGIRIKAMGKHRIVLEVSAIAVLALALAACAGSSPPKTVDANAFPAAYKAEILKIMPEIVADPSNMRDTGISDITLTPIGNERRYTVCVRFNPRKSKTDYDGIQERFGVFYGGELAQFTLATPEQCGKVAYKPFPELEKLCFGNRCKSANAK